MSHFHFVSLVLISFCGVILFLATVLHFIVLHRFGLGKEKVIFNRFFVSIGYEYQFFF